MNLDNPPDMPCRATSAAAWICAIACATAVAGYIGWASLAESFAASQAALHPIAVPQIILKQIGQAATPLEWNIPFWSIFVWLIWLIGTLGGGWVFLGRVLPFSDSVPNSVRATLAFVSGFCIIGTSQALLGLTGIVAFPLFLVGNIALLFSVRKSPRIRSDISGFARAAAWQWRTTKPVTRRILICGAIAAALMLVPALTPPIQSDAIRYHLGAPQEYLKLGRIAYLPLNAYSNMPFLVEMHYMSALACRAPEASQLMHFTLAIFTALAIYAALRLQQQHNSDWNGMPRQLLVLASALYFFTPMSAVLATWPFSDHAISLMLIASLITMLFCIREVGHRPRHWILLGICLGGLIGTKYTMAPIAVVVLLTTLLARWKLPHASANFRTSILNAFVAGLVCLLTGGVWYLKNLLFTGNPFYPLASSIFPGGDWSAINDKFLLSRAGLKGVGTDFSALISFPWNATFHWPQFEAHNPAVTILICSIFAVCAMVIAVRCSHRRERLAVAVVIVSSIGVWFFSYQSNRLLLPAIAAALCLTPVSAVASHTLPRRILTAALGIACAIGIAWAIQWSWIATALSPPPLPYLLGAQDADVYRYKSLTNARAFDYLNQQVDPEDTVLLIGEHRIYGARFNAIWSDWFDTPALAVILRRENINSTQALLQYLRSNQINWLVINEAELAPQMEQAFHPWFAPGEWEIFQELRTLQGTGIQRLQFPPGVTVLHLESGK